MLIKGPSKMIKREYLTDLTKQTGGKLSERTVTLTFFFPVVSMETNWRENYVSFEIPFDIA